MRTTGATLALADLSDLSAEGLTRVAHAAPALRSAVPVIAREAADRIRREVPQYVRPDDPRYARTLEAMVEVLIGHFVDLMGDGTLSSDGVLEFAREVGAGEAREGRSLDAWRSAVRIGAGVAIVRLTDQAERLGLNTHVSEIGQIAQAVFAYTDRVTEEAAAGYADAEAGSGGRTDGRRHRLLAHLLDPDPPARPPLDELARRAGWRLPATVAAVALRARDTARPRPPDVPPDALCGLHLDDPVVILPDPDGPGRRQRLIAGLDGWIAAIGPPVPVTDCAKSARWAHQGLALADAGLVGTDAPIVVTDHLPALLMLRERELVELVAADRLAIFDERPALRNGLADTLLALIEHRFNSTAVAAALHVHPQTVRYRLRKLEQLLGPTLYTPDTQLTLHLILHARRTGLVEPNPL
ncbi:PucR family transcriptional regulator [Actinomadura flavalba]|uniref:PucR family transcriptional regulator n=1 Tax=Actinomadura flavalba TaxID=1120938 RepID=UPI0003799DF2|nr:helix-turn-helix domain-containing protein [Actinomadura flavalba]